ALVPSRDPAVGRRSVGALELGVLVAVRFAGWTSEDPPGSEHCAGHFLAELRVTRIPLCVWRTLPQNDGFDHVILLLSRSAERIASLRVRERSVERVRRRVPPARLAMDRRFLWGADRVRHPVRGLA